jgi:hypothetical protein
MGRGIVVVAHPNPSNQLGNIAYKPQVSILLRGPCFTRHRAPQVSIAASPPFYYSPQHPGHNGRCVSIYGLSIVVGGLVDDLTFAVEHPANAVDWAMNSFIGQGAVGAGQLE